MAIYEWLLLGLVVLAAGYIQSVTGFAFGIVAMIFLPHLLVYTEANLLSSILSTLTSAVMILSVARHIDWKNLLFPLVGSIFANYFAITFVKQAQGELLTLLLGIALFGLSIYFFFFSHKIRFRPTPVAGLIAGLASGVLSGLFSIGGPPIVIYYMQSERETEKYLATVSAYFVLSGFFAIGMKVFSGFFTAQVGVGLAIGLPLLLLGSLLGRLTRGHLSPAAMKKAVYGVMAVSGIVNVVTSLL